MPNVTANDFKLMNSTSEFANQVNQALAYLQQQDPRLTDVLRLAADTGIAIMNNPIDNMNVDAETRGGDYFGHIGNQSLALWNPESALLVKNNGIVTGLQSAADGLLHELIHGLDVKLQEVVRTN